MARLILDTGALIAVERNHRETLLRIQVAVSKRQPLVIPAGVLAQAWRDPATQVQLTKLRQGCMVERLDESVAKKSGELCRTSGSNDVIDASVVIAADEQGGQVLTSDPKDIQRLVDAASGARIQVVAV